MEKRLRLRAGTDFGKVWREGRSWAHPLLVLCVVPNKLGHNRFGFSVSKRIGGAVVRNRAKRRMREATRPFKDALDQGWDVVFVARGPISGAQFRSIKSAIEVLLRRACLLGPASGPVHPNHTQND